MAFNRRTERRMELEIGGPIRRPGGQELDTSAVALHQHVLKGDHSRSAVVDVGNPVVVFAPEPSEAMVAVAGEFVDRGFFGVGGESKACGFGPVLAPAFVERK